MNLATQLAAIRGLSELTMTERASHSCHLAKELEKAGEYEAASEALGDFWPDRTASPTVEGLDRQAAADVFLRVGTLIGWLGGATQSQRQESAKDFITRSIEIFTELGEGEKVAEAQSDLALCYWREGAFDEARVHLSQALERLESEGDLKATALIRAGAVEVLAGQFTDALQFYEQARPLVEQSTDSALKGSLSLSRATVFTRLANATSNEKYLDRALEEYTSAAIYFEQAGHERQCGRVENNLGFLYQNISRFPEAHEHINRAHDIFLSLGDEGHVAQVNDTRARALLAEGRYREAERYARAAVKTLDRGDECSLLVEALTTHGIALARLGKYSTARSELSRAIEAGENCGDLEGAGRACLSLIEELGNQTPAEDLAVIYHKAADLLEKSQDPLAAKRLINCGRKTIDSLLAESEKEVSVPPKKSWEGFSLKREIRVIERRLIKRALRDAGGSVTEASRMLGFKHHQSLISLLDTRLSDLKDLRSKKRARRRPLLVKARKGKASISQPDRATAKVSVLHVEDDKQVANVIKDFLSAEGMQVDSCGNGMTALRILTGDARYDVVIVDNDLPGLSGLELARRVRKITHRRKTPIIMLSGDEIETEAWRAGVKEFLRKPEDINRVAATVERLVTRRKRK